MKNRLSILFLIFLSTGVMAQDIDSLYRCFESAPRTSKRENANELFLALYDEGSVGEYDSLFCLGDLSMMESIVNKGMSRHYFGTGNYKEGLRTAEKALELAPVDSVEIRISILSYISTMAYYCKEYERALDACMQRLAIMDPNDIEVRASVCNTLSAIYTEMGSMDSKSIFESEDNSLRKEYLEQALRFSQEAVALRRSLGNDERGLLSGFLGKQAETLSNLQRPDEALEVLDEAIELDLEAGRMQQYYTHIGQKGHIFLVQNKNKEANTMYSEALQHTDPDKNPNSYVTLLCQIGYTELNMKHYEAAAAYFDRYFKMTEEKGLTPMIHSYQRAAQCFEKINPDKAIYFLNQYIAVKDSISNIEFQKQFSDFQVKYETAEKDHLIEQQQIENEQQRYRNRMLLFTAIILIAGLVIIGILALHNHRKSKKLQELNDTKSRLFSIISHDLKNPIIAQKRIIDLLSDEKKVGLLSESDKQQSLAALKQSSDSVNEMLQNLLQWASIEMGKTECNPISIDLYQIVQTVVGQLTLQATQKGITLSSSVAPNTLVTADMNVLQTILRNLISNSIKFSETGKSIEIMAQPIDRKVRLCIVDHGIGIPPEKLEALFTMKSRSAAGTAGEKGTGLGLFICQGLAHRMGTNIQIESTVGQGSRFCLDLQK